MKIIINLPPIAQKRHRTGRWGMYDPSHEDKENVKLLLSNQIKNEYLGEGPLKVSAEFLFPIPKATSKIKKEKMDRSWHIKRPDIDNCLKFYMDVLQDMGVFKDDSQICSLSLIKIYSPIPRVEIEITKL